MWLQRFISESNSVGNGRAARDTDAAELEMGLLSGTSHSDDPDLLGPYRPATIQADIFSLGRLHDQFRGSFNNPKRCSRRVIQCAYPFSLIMTGAVMSWIIIMLWQPRRLDPFDIFFNNFWDDRRTWSNRYPADIFGGVLPIPCHSHNDYWRRTPLFAALWTGCTSIEADVWLRESDLYVGHREQGVSSSRTLQGMYINHLMEILDERNSDTTAWRRDGPKGVFYEDPKQTLTLLIDFKGAASETWQVLYHQLRPLRERGWLTHWNGTHRIERPVTVVATGNADFHTLVDDHPVRDIFLDAPLNKLEHFSDDSTSFHYNASNSHLASVNFFQALGTLSPTGFSDDQMQKLRLQIRSAKDRGPVPRSGGTPRWPRGLRDEVWTVLIQENVGLLNVDDLRAVRRGGWGSWSHGVMRFLRRQGKLGRLRFRQDRAGHHISL